MKQLTFHNPRFMTSATSLEGCPPPLLPEIAIVGRSNVGKSSLLNYLLQRKGLAKTSSTPGKTRLLNFFLIDDQLQIADLPGYGYAKGDTTSWGEMITSYLKGRENLKLLLFLIDIRRLPSTEDLQMFQWALYHALPMVIVLTKSDQLNRSQRTAQAQKILSSLGSNNFPYVCVSALKREGRNELIGLILNALR